MPFLHTWCHCWISCSCVKTATLTFTSPPPLRLPGLHRFAPSCMPMMKHAFANEAASSSFPLPASCALQPFAVGSSAVGLSQPAHLHHHHQPLQHLSHKNPITFTHLLLSQISILQHPCIRKNSSKAVTFQDNLPSCILPLPFCSARLASATVPLSHPHHYPLISEELFRKKQASCLFFLQKCLLAGQLVFRCPSGG